MIAEIDALVAAWLQGHASANLSATMRLVSQWNATPLLLLATMVLGIVLLWRRDHEALWILLLAVPAGTALNHLLKHTIRRPRPDDVAGVATTDYAFPSGHVATATLFYGFVAVWILLRARSWPAKAAAVIIAMALVATVAASRLVLRAHHLSDVVAAAIGGLAWLCLSVGVVRRGRRKKPRDGG